MARTETEQLVVSLEARVRQFERNFAKANRTAGRNFRQIESRAQTSARRLELSLGRASQNVTRQFTMMGRSMAGALGLGLGVAGLQRMTRDVLNTAGAIADAAETTGLGIEGFQRYAYAAEMSGLSVDQFRQAIERMNRRAADGAHEWQGSALATLEMLADEVANAANEAEAASIAYRSFGQSGLQLLPFLRQGSQGIRQLADEADRLGLVIDGGTIRAADALADELDRLIAVARTNFQAGFMRGLVGDSDNLREIYSDPAFIQGLQDLGEFISTSIGFLVRNADTITRVMSAMAGAWAGAKAGSIAGPWGRAAGGVAGGIAGALAPELMEGERAAESLNDELGETPVVLGKIKVEADKLATATGGKSPFEPLEQATKNARFELELLQSELDETGRNIARQLHGFGLIDSVSDLQGPQPGPVQDYIGAQRGLEAEQGRQAQMEADRQRAAQIFEETRTQAERYKATLEEINRLEAQGHLDRETAQRAATDAWHQYSEEAAMSREIMGTFGNAATNAFMSVVSGGASAEEALLQMIEQIILAIIQTLILRAVSGGAPVPFTGAPGGGQYGFGGGYAKGGAFGRGGEVQQFAKGGTFANSVVNRPTPFRYGSDKLGIMGEAGPEAILPLKRMPNGKLGVEGTAGGGSKVFAPTVNINIDQPKVSGEGDSHQLAKDIARAVDITLEGKMAQFLRQQMRPGNMLNP